MLGPHGSMGRVANPKRGAGHPLATRLGNEAQLDFVTSLRGQWPAGLSWTRELDRLSVQAQAQRAELSARAALAACLAHELGEADDALAACEHALERSLSARELLTHEVHALRAQLADSGAPRYAEATLLAHRAREAIAERDVVVAAHEARVQELQALLADRDAQLEAARDALALGGRLTREARRAGRQLHETAERLAAEREAAFRLQAELAAARQRCEALEAALSEAYAQLQGQLDVARGQAMRAVGEELRATLSGAAHARELSEAVVQRSPSRGGR
jgi:predicted  nucleic acid-binding Zn-ribbon protein